MKVGGVDYAGVIEHGTNHNDTPEAARMRLRGDRTLEVYATCEHSRGRVLHVVPESEVYRQGARIGEVQHARGTDDEPYCIEQATHTCNLFDYAPAAAQPTARLTPPWEERTYVAVRTLSWAVIVGAFAWCVAQVLS